MKPRQHAYLARALQDACGGVDPCANILEASPYKLGRSHLYRTRDPGSGYTMPIGAVEMLETVSGKRLYTSVICARSTEPTDAECAVSEACELTETVATLQRLVREAARDNEFSEHEKRDIEPVIMAVERLCIGLRAAMDGSVEPATTAEVFPS